MESVYESQLRGKHGQIEIEVDAQGQLVKNLGEAAPVPGENLQLTIDVGLQKVLYASLMRMLVMRPSATGAAAVAISPKNGEVLALVSLPSFDNNLFARGISSREYEKLTSDSNRPMFNRAISGAYPPGSVVKPMVGAAALEEGVITTKTKITDRGFVQAGNTIFYGWNREGLGVLDIIGAIAQSSDPFFYIVGGGNDEYGISGLGVGRLSQYFKKFHLGTKLGIVLPGEADGFVPTEEWKKERFAGTDEEKWYLGNTYHLAIGQGYLLTTPLQVAEFTAALANGGKMYKPVLTAGTAELIADAGISKTNMEIIQKAMRENVVSGSGIRLLDLPVAVAGKTGSAQFDARNPALTHAWYTSFAPADNPQIVLTVMVEAGGEGHAASVPVVKEVLKWWSENRTGN